MYVYVNKKTNIIILIFPLDIIFVNNVFIFMYMTFAKQVPEGFSYAKRFPPSGTWHVSPGSNDSPVGVVMKGGFLAIVWPFFAFNLVKTLSISMRGMSRTTQLTVMTNHQGSIVSSSA